MLPWWKTLCRLGGTGTLPTALSGTSSASLFVGATNPNIGLPASWLENVGDTLLVRVAGAFTNIATTPGTITFNVTLGGTTVAGTGAIQLSTTAHATAVTFEMNLWMRVAASPGTACTLEYEGWAASQAFSLAADSTTTQASIVLIPATSPGPGSSFNSQVLNAFDITGIFSITGNTFQARQAMLVSCG